MRQVSLGLFILALVLMQLLIGGAGLIFSLPVNVVLAGAGILLLFRKEEGGRNPMALWGAIATLLLAGYVIGRTQFSPVVYLARWDLFLALGAVISYFAVSTYFVRARDRLAIMAVLVALGLVHVVIGGIQFKREDEFMLIPGIIRSLWTWRASGFYICPNHLAGLLEMLGMMCLSICCWGRVSNWWRILAGYCVLMCVAGIALTGSRGGYLSIVFGMLCFLVLSLWVIRWVQPRLLWPMCAAALVGIVLFVGGTLYVMGKSNSLSERLALVYDPTNMRPLMWQAAMKQYQLDPVIGTGSGTYLYYGREFRSPQVQNDPIFVHNDYLHLLAEYGNIGAALGGIFLLVHLLAGLGGIRRIVKEKLLPEWRASSNELALVVGALSGIMALLAHSVVDFNFHIPANALLGAMYFAILATPSATLKAVAAEPLRGRGWLLWVAPAVSVVMLGLAVPLLPGEYLNETARRAVRDRKYEEGRALAEQSVQKDRLNPNAWYHLGEALHFQALGIEDSVNRGAVQELAAEAYVAGLELFPRDTRLLLKLGRTFDVAGRFEEAENTYQRAFSCDPNFGNVYAYYGLHLQMQRQLNNAETFFRKAYDLLESEISLPALAEIERVRKSDIGRRLAPAPGTQIEFPEPPPAPPEAPATP